MQHTLSDIESIIDHWNALSESEAKAYVDYMSQTPSDLWLQLMLPAQHGKLLHSEILLARQDEIYEMIAEILAASDDHRTHENN